LLLNGKAFDGRKHDRHSKTFVRPRHPGSRLGSSNQAARPRWSHRLREGERVIEFDFELGNAGIIYCPSAKSWDQDFPWAAGRRSKIIERVACEFVRREFGGYHWAFAEGRDDTVLVTKPVS